jgi:hypothetical protein
MRIYLMTQKGPEKTTVRVTSRDAIVCRPSHSIIESGFNAGGRLCDVYDPVALRESKAAFTEYP